MLQNQITTGLLLDHVWPIKWKGSIVALAFSLPWPQIDCPWNLRMFSASFKNFVKAWLLKVFFHSLHLIFCHELLPHQNIDLYQGWIVYCQQSMDNTSQTPNILGHEILKANRVEKVNAWTFRHAKLVDLISLTKHFTAYSLVQSKELSSKLYRIHRCL